MSSRNLAYQLLRKVIAFHPVFVDLTGSTPSAVLLSQLLYHHEQLEGRQKSFIKTNSSLCKETKLTESTFRRAKKVLEDLKFIRVAHVQTDHDDRLVSCYFVDMEFILDSIELLYRHDGCQNEHHVDKSVDNHVDKVITSFPTPVQNEQEIMFKSTHSEDHEREEKKIMIMNDHSLDSLLASDPLTGVEAEAVSETQKAGNSTQNPEATQNVSTAPVKRSELTPEPRKPITINQAIPDATKALYDEIIALYPNKIDISAAKPLLTQLPIPAKTALEAIRAQIKQKSALGSAPPWQSLSKWILGGGWNDSFEAPQLKSAGSSAVEVYNYPTKKLPVDKFAVPPQNIPGPCKPEYLVDRTPVTEGQIAESKNHFANMRQMLGQGLKVDPGV